MSWWEFRGFFGGILQRSLTVSFQTWHYPPQWCSPSLSFQNAEYHYLACRTAITSAFAVSTKIAFIQFDGIVKDFIGSQYQMIADEHTDFTEEQCSQIRMNAQNISSGTSGNLVTFSTKNEAVLYFYLFYNILYSFFKDNTTANLVQPQYKRPSENQVPTKRNRLSDGLIYYLFIG